MPKLSIVIPTYNRGDLIGETLKSVQLQEFEDLEIIVVDDGSTDQTEELCLRFAQEDPRIHYIPNDRKNRGPSYCRNMGARRALGDYLIFLDSDDLLLPGALGNRVAKMESASEMDFLVFVGEFFQREPGDLERLWNIPLPVDPLLRFLGDDVPWQTSGPIWRRSSLAKFEEWDEAIMGCDDQDFHTRVLFSNPVFEETGEIDYAIRGAVDGREQLGQVLVTASGLKAKIAMIRNSLVRLSALDGSRLARARKIIAGSLLLRSVETVETHRQVNEAVQLWGLSRKKELVPFWIYFLGMVWLKNYKSFLGEIAAYYLNRFGGADFLLKKRAQLGTIPRSCLASASYDGRYHRQLSFVGGAAVAVGLGKYLRSKLTLFRGHAASVKKEKK